MASTATSSDTIFALSSAPGRSGVAVVRVSGTATSDALKALCGAVPAPRLAALRKVCDPRTDAMIDRGLVLWFPGPGSFTGEDLAELQIHGGRAVVAALLDALASIDGCRMAEPGEFAMRAFENGKIDFTEAEGLADLIDAETEAQRVQALRQAEGAISLLTERWRSELIEAMGLIEAAIDFSDEGDVSDQAVVMAEDRVGRLLDEVSQSLKDGHRGEILRDGFQVVLAGAPNVGKSSLLNALAKRDVAIVSSEAGTTRDVIEVRLDLEGLPVVISDTAGLREAVGEVEQEGIRRTLARTERADLVAWVVDGSSGGMDGSTGSADRTDVSRNTSKAMPDGALVVLNKCDLVDNTHLCHPDGRVVAVSAKTGAGLGELTSLIAEIARESIGASEGGVITQARHRQHLLNCESHLKAFQENVRDVELRAEELRLAADALGRISGRVDPEDVLDQVFGRFCIGK